MTLAIRFVPLVMVLLMGISTHAQTPRQSRRTHDTWYEFMVRQFNGSDVDYGAWIEKRREALLEATVKTPYFWYSASVSTGLLILLFAYTVLYMNHRRGLRITAEMMTDLYNHDLYSRQAAREAIEKYNRHIEECNRSIEEGNSADSRPGWGDAHLEALKVELQRVGTELEATTQERNKLHQELSQKAQVMADLSMRLDVLSKRVGAQPSAGTAQEKSSSPPETGDGARFVGHINKLQEELYTERQRNKRLKGV